MPKVIGATPPYLCRPSPGSQIFGEAESRSPTSPSKGSLSANSPDGSSSLGQYQGPRRLVASRGAEIFTVVGNRIRWADLVAVRDEWEENTQSGNRRSGLSRSGSSDAAVRSVYRVCRTLHAIRSGLTIADSCCTCLLPDSPNIHLPIWSLPGHLHGTHSSHSYSTRPFTFEGGRPITDQSQDLPARPDSPCHPRVSAGFGVMAPIGLCNDINRLSYYSDGRSRSPSMGVRQVKHLVG